MRGRVKRYKVSYCLKNELGGASQLYTNKFTDLKSISFILDKMDDQQDCVVIYDSKSKANLTIWANSEIEFVLEICDGEKGMVFSRAFSMDGMLEVDDFLIDAFIANPSEHLFVAEEI